METFLILGGSGFIGSHLVEHLLRRGDSVISLARRPGNPGGRGVGSHLTIDVRRQFEEVRSLIASRRPTHIINLIGGRGDSSLEYALFSYRLARGLAENRVRARLVLVGSAAEYGFPAFLPVDETHPLRPISDYGFTKAVQSWTARAIHDECGLPILVARLFNVTGPRQHREFLVGSAVAQAVDMLMGTRHKADVGNVDSVRDFIDVRDVATALERIATRGRAGEAYNVCGGQPVLIRDVLHKVGELCGISRDFYATVPDLCREEVPVIYGSNQKIAQDTGWMPTIDLDRTIQEMIAHEKAARNRGSVGA